MPFPPHRIGFTGCGGAPVASERSTRKDDPLKLTRILRQPAWFYLPIALYHFDRREYEEALATAKKIAISGFYWARI